MKNIKITKLSQNKITNCPHLVDSNYENLLTSISFFWILEPPIVFPIPNREYNWRFRKPKVCGSPISRNCRISQKHYTNALVRICDTHGFPRLTGHSPRHSFVHQLCEDGYDTKEIQEVLAHKSEKTTLVYIAGRHPKTGSTKTVAEVNQRYRIQKALME